MSLYVVEVERTNWIHKEWFLSEFIRQDPYKIRTHSTTRIEYEIRDPNEHNGEWYATITLAHGAVEWEGFHVPAFEGDVERIAWEKTHGRSLHRALY